MSVLHLGVIEIPYSHQQEAQKPAPKKGKKLSKKSKKLQASTQTTFDVATILEAKYGIMAQFLGYELEDLGTLLESGLAKTLESIMMGAPLTIDPFGEATSKIEERFKSFLDRGVLNDLTSPKSKHRQPRMKHPYSKNNQERPAFIATGLYQASFKAWVE